MIEQGRSAPPNGIFERIISMLDEGNPRLENLIDQALENNIPEVQDLVQRAIITAPDVIRKTSFWKRLTVDDKGVFKWLHQIREGNSELEVQLGFALEWGDPVAKDFLERAIELDPLGVDHTYFRYIAKQIVEDKD